MNKESEIANIFAEIFGVDDVNKDDNFFDLGGESLLATRLISRVRESLDKEMGIVTLFEAPTVAGLAKRLEEAGGARATLARRPRPDRVPVSSAQQRLWFLDRLEGSSATYNNAFLFRLHGRLDIPALRAAIADIVDRHESLRTVFQEEDGTPWQIVLAGDAAMPFLDIVEAAEADLHLQLARASGYCFDLAAEIPIRTTLFRLGEDEHVLLLLIHHIASDGWSMTPLARDLGVAYAGRCDGNAPSWSLLPVQYADYTLWQRELLGEEDRPDSLAARQVAYWREALAGLPQQIELPVDRCRPPVASYRGDRLSFHIGAPLHRCLTELAQESQATLFMVLQAGLASLLGRLGAGTDIPIGTPIAGRTDTALDHLVGFFVNTLVLRTGLSGNPSFREVVARARAACVAAYAHQDLPFDRLVEILNPVRSMAYQPMFQVMLVQQNSAEGEYPSAGLRIVPQGIGVGAGTAKFDLTFSFAEDRAANGEAQGIRGTLDYATDLFDRTTAEELAQRLVRLLAAVAADPGLPVTRVELLGVAERLTVLEEWNATALPLPETTLPALFEARAGLCPEDVAVLFEERTLSYAELNVRANALAHLLIGERIGPEALVALVLPRSPEMVVAMLAVHKAGAAYLPLDPDYPPDRLAFIIKDASPLRVLTTTRLSARLAGVAGLLCLDAPEIRAALAEASSENPTDHRRVRPLDPHDAAYVIYTSGSTGVPKGVVVSHASLCRKILGNRDMLGIGAASCYAATAPVGFDPLITQILSPLTVGGRTLLVPDQARADPALFWRLVTGQRRCIVGVTPTFLDQLLECLAQVPPDGQVETLTVGGEPLPAHLAAKARDRRLACRIINFYGPTETCIDATAWQIPETDDGVVAVVPIGRPLVNYRLYVLDGGLRPVPAGVAGELYIAGPGLARGYRMRPRLTAERFVADPFAGSGDRMYRTGDLARWRVDGVLEFLGRVDQQVKIRGFRVEPQEIQAILAAHPSVAQSAVVARPGRSGALDLVGYVVLADGAATPAALRRHLAERLPGHMVPAAIVPMAALPLTPNGKLDHGKLPEPAVASSAGSEPRTPQESRLAVMFAEVLGVDGIGIDDSFFDLGGHSLLATKLISRIRAGLGMEVSVRTLFEAPSVALLAGRLGQPSHVTRPVLKPRARRPGH